MSTDTAEAPARTRMRPVDPRLLRYARASRGFFVAIAVIGTLQTLTIIAFAWFLTRAITGAIDGMPGPELAATLGFLAITVVVRSALLWVRELVAARAAARVEAQLRLTLVEAVDDLGPGWLATRNTAQLAVTAGRGLDALDAYFGRYLPQLVQTVIATPVIIAVMWWQDWISGLTVLLTIPLIPIFMVLIGLATRAVQEKQWKTLSSLAARFADTVEGLSTLKVFGRQHRAAASIERVTGTYRRETMRVLRVSFLSGFALEFLASIAVAVIAVSIGFRLLDGSLALVVGLFVLLLAPEAYLPLRQVGVQFHAAAEGVAATDDVFSVLDAARALSSAPSAPERASVPELVEGSPPGHAPSTSSGTGAVRSLRLEGLRVRRGERMLEPVDLVAAPGSVTLIEGPSGAGKSSILAALRGAADFDGSATYAGRDVRALRPAQWLAWAGQQPGLVAGTVFENVALGDPSTSSGTGAGSGVGVGSGTGGGSGTGAGSGADARRARAARALELAGAETLDLDLELGVQGSGLSGGQAQRVAVARAIHHHLSGAASVIALDEPSSALDAETEARLWRSVRSLADDGATVLLVSHRRSARDIADTVLSLEPAEVLA